MNKVSLLIGGNQGDRWELIEQATEQIRQRIGSVVALSKVYETEPWGDFEIENSKLKIENFLNRALLVETTLSPWQVLRTALSIEAALGRKRDHLSPFTFHLSPRKYHSRPMDIDLIFYDDFVVETPELTLPHPRMHQRQFVLEPLAEIMPDYVHPVTGMTVLEMLEGCPATPSGFSGDGGGLPSNRGSASLHPCLGTYAPPAGLAKGTPAGGERYPSGVVCAGVETPAWGPTPRQRGLPKEPPQGVNGTQAGVITPVSRGETPVTKERNK